MNVIFLKDEKLKFGRKVEAFDPRIGWLKGGPFGPSDSRENEPEFRVINCGVIGTSSSIIKCRHYFQRISQGLDPVETTYGNLGYPGLGRKSPLNFSIRILPEWEMNINTQKFDEISNTISLNKRKNILFEIYSEKIHNLNDIDPPPDIILLPLPQEIFNAFTRKNLSTNDIIFANLNEPDSVYESEGDINLHSILKIIGMNERIPTQIIKPETLEFNAKEDAVTTAWNISAGLYYKAKGIPWKFSQLGENTCYVGVSFYRDFSKETPTMNTSMAQIYLYTGESFILRGESFEWDKSSTDKIPHLSCNLSSSLINKILQLYYDLKKNFPSRVDIYKSSYFMSEEIEGFYTNIANVHTIDMITIDPRPKIRFYRYSDYPIVRGTLISSRNMRRNYLFTNGFIPVLGTYPGMRVPVPLEIRSFTNDSDIEIVSKEILALTRLNWNNIKYCQNDPVTLAFSRNVGKILQEARSRNLIIHPHYRFYM